MTEIEAIQAVTREQVLISWVAHIAPSAGSDLTVLDFLYATPQPAGEVGV